MLLNLLRTLKGETVFVKTAAPRKYQVGAVVMIDIGDSDRALFRVTGLTQDKSGLYSVWGTQVDTVSPNDAANTRSA